MRYNLNCKMYKFFKVRILVKYKMLNIWVCFIFLKFYKDIVEVIKWYVLILIIILNKKVCYFIINWKRIFFVEIYII